MKRQWFPVSKDKNTFSDEISYICQIYIVIGHRWKPQNATMVVEQQLPCCSTWSGGRMSHIQNHHRGGYTGRYMDIPPCCLSVFCCISVVLGEQYPHALFKPMGICGHMHMDQCQQYKFLWVRSRFRLTFSSHVTPVKTYFTYHRLNQDCWGASEIIRKTYLRRIIHHPPSLCIVRRPRFKNW